MKRACSAVSNGGPAVGAGVGGGSGGTRVGAAMLAAGAVAVPVRRAARGGLQPAARLATMLAASSPLIRAADARAILRPKLACILTNIPAHVTIIVVGALARRAFFLRRCGPIAAADGEGMRTLEWQAERGTLRLIDQRALPAELRFVELTSAGEVEQAIREMTVRGAPAIGVAAAFGLALAALHSRANSTGELLGDLQSAAALLRAARPTAVNLGWAIDRTLRVAREAASRAVADGRRRGPGEAH